jgi:hypothetical protein
LHSRRLVEAQPAFLERDPALSADHQVIEHVDVK